VVGEEEFYNSPLPTYGQSPQFQLPVSEDQNWKNQYTHIDFENKSFNYLKKKLEKLDIPKEKIDDLIEELEIIINNAGKMKISTPTIKMLLDIFDTAWDNYCIYVMKNSRWIDELNHVHSYAMQVLLQEYYKSIDGWQGDNILRTRIEHAHDYNLRQENVSTAVKRGWFRNKKSSAVMESSAAQGFDLSKR